MPNGKTHKKFAMAAGGVTTFRRSRVETAGESAGLCPLRIDCAKPNAFSCQPGDVKGRDAILLQCGEPVWRA